MGREVPVVLRTARRIVDSTQLNPVDLRQCGIINTLERADSPVSETGETSQELMRIERIHHVAIICSDYVRSKRFYTETLGLRIINETFREDRKSFKLDLALNDGSQLELFSFPAAPARLSYPEACGLRHLALQVGDLQACLLHLERMGVKGEPIRVDEFTGKRFLFISDPDGLPLELYENDQATRFAPASTFPSG